MASIKLETMHNGVHLQKNNGSAEQNNMVFESADHLASYVRQWFIEYYGRPEDVLELFDADSAGQAND